MRPFPTVCLLFRVQSAQDQTALTRISLPLVAACSGPLGRCAAMATKYAARARHCWRLQATAAHWSAKGYLHSEITVERATSMCEENVLGSFHCCCLCTLLQGSFQDFLLSLFGGNWTEHVPATWHSPGEPQTLG